MNINRFGEVGFNNFGSLMWISSYRNSKDIDVYFPHRDYMVKHTRYNEFKNGNIKCPYDPNIYNKGYLGEGKYKAKENGKYTKAYKVWSSMLCRCYNTKFHEKNPTYKGCAVCEEWYNFQNFAAWFENNYYEISGEVMCLDKDILTKGNRIYSPNTCIFVPKSINSLFIKSDASRGELPIGTYYDNHNNKYRSQCRINNQNKYLGCYSTPEEAFMAYKTFKERYIKQVADQYIDLIPQSLYNAMYEYEVENED